MANTILKAEKIVEAAWLLLQREIVLPATVYRDFSKDDYRYTKNDTITLGVPAVMEARRRTLRSTDALVFDEFAESSVDVKVDQHVYKGIRVTDENLTLDIKSFARQVLAPQMRAVAENLEELVVEGLTAAAADAYADPVDWDASNPYGAALRARAALNEMNVPRSDRFLVVGSDIEVSMLEDDHFSRADVGGEAQAVSALREASLGKRVAGFTVLSSNALAPDQAFAYHRTALAFAQFAPDVPMGASAGSTIQSEGMGMRYIRDYNPTDANGPADRSLVDCFAGVSSVSDTDNPAVSGTDLQNVRIVEIDFHENS